MSLDREILSELRTISKLLLGLLTTARFSRGGYDGPFLSSREINIPFDRAVEIFPGRGDPTAIVIDVMGTGVANSIVSVSDDAGTVRAGWRLPVVNDAQLRFIADARQRYYAQADSTGPVTIRVVEGRL